MNDENENMYDLSLMAWVRYNPKWLLDKVDDRVRRVEADEEVFTLDQVREAYRAGFEAGVLFKITKEIPRVGNES